MSVNTKLSVGDRATIRYQKVHLGHGCQVTALKRKPAVRGVWDSHSHKYIEKASARVVYTVQCSCGSQLQLAASHLNLLERNTAPLHELRVAVGFDGVLYPGVGEFELVTIIRPQHFFPGPLHIITGRWESSRSQVLGWLRYHNFCVTSLDMTPDGQDPLEFKRQVLHVYSFYITDDLAEAKALASERLRVLCLETMTLH